MAFAFNEPLEVPPEIKPFWTKVASGQVKVCPLTMRPIYRVSAGKTWRDDFKEKMGVAPEEANFLSLFKLFGTFACRFNRYPSLDEMVAVAHKQSQTKGQVLPVDVVEMCT